ncbi:hypothetical protein HK100_009164, partial [Physocladia obscura]
PSMHICVYYTNTDPRQKLVKPLFPPSDLHFMFDKQLKTPQIPSWHAIVELILTDSVEFLTNDAGIRVAIETEVTRRVLASFL